MISNYYKWRATRLLQKYAPQEVASVDALMSQYSSGDRYTDMMVDLQSRYGPESPVTQASMASAFPGGTTTASIVPSSGGYSTTVYPSSSTVTYGHTSLPRREVAYEPSVSATAATSTYEPRVTYTVLKDDTQGGMSSRVTTNLTSDYAVSSVYSSSIPSTAFSSRQVTTTITSHTSHETLVDDDAIILAAATAKGLAVEVSERQDSVSNFGFASHYSVDAESDVSAKQISDKIAGRAGPAHEEEGAGEGEGGDATDGGKKDGGDDSAGGADASDPHKWLENVLAEKSLDWVKARNEESTAAIGDPKKTKTYQRIVDILDSKDKIPHIFRIPRLKDNAKEEEESFFYNFWQDDEHVQGIWRRTDLKSYKAGKPEWKTVIDVDALPPPETGTAKTWVWHGSTLLEEGPIKGEKGPQSCGWDRALIKLSPGGSDASTFREFDLLKEAWVDEKDGGFALAEPAKSRVGFRSRNELLIGTDFGGDGSTLTDSGYPRIVKSWKRGTPLSEAVTVFEGEQADVAANQYSYHDHGFAHEWQCRSITFYTSKYWYRSLTVDGVNSVTAAEETTPFKEVPIPEDAEISTHADSALITLRTAWTPPGSKTEYASGALLALPMADLMESKFDKTVQLYEPTETGSLESQTGTRDYLILKVLNHVRTELTFWKYDVPTQTWSKDPHKKAAAAAAESAVNVGEDVSLGSIHRNSDADNQVWIWRDGYLVPSTQELASAEDGCVSSTKIKQQPNFFNTDGLTVQQHFAKSLDGTEIPFFVIGRKEFLEGQKGKGKGKGKTAAAAAHPTMLDAYGGFEISMLPRYSGGVGAGWLELGGIKVIANIRGGGEYGPKWHQATLKEKRHKCYEDVEAVAHSLIHTLKITTPEKLAVIGGSNGGLMVGNIISRWPHSTGPGKLFGAAVCQVPLLDMKTYSKLLAGASWMAEYGNPDVPEEWKALRNHSPYHILRHDRLGLPEGEEGEASSSTDDNAKWQCPKVLFTTSTRDDRVHPGHARKMVRALLTEGRGKVPKSDGAGEQADETSAEDASSDKAPTVYYWENMEGGHGGAADNKQRAFMWALTYSFLARELGLKTPV